MSDERSTLALYQRIKHCYQDEERKSKIYDLTVARRLDNWRGLETVMEVNESCYRQ